MQLRFYANMRKVLGLPALEIEEEVIKSFRRLVEYLVEQYPEAAFHLLDDNGDLRKDVPVYVNGNLDGWGNPT